MLKCQRSGVFNGALIVKNPPSSAGDVGFISGWETKILYAAVQRSTHFSNKDPVQPKNKKVSNTGCIPDLFNQNLQGWGLGICLSK